MIKISGAKENIKNKKIYIFGAGAQGKDVLGYLKENEIEVQALIDNDKSKIGMNVFGTPVVGLDDTDFEGEEIFIITARDKETVCRQLEEKHAKYVVDINEIKYMFPLKEYEDDYKLVVPFNHYESPYSDIRYIRKHEKSFWNIKNNILDIDFNLERQKELLCMMKALSLPSWEENMKYRYYYNNGWFERGSADVLSFMMQIIKPKKIIEVGSGFSTAVMLDTNNEFFGNAIEIVSIEPRADRLKSLLRTNDNIKILENELQEMNMDFFTSLEENDILFIDSSHVGHIGSDINLIFFELLPRLNRKVYIHFHDMFYPFEYPQSWVYEGRAYNEMYYLRAFLMNNSSYSIQFFGDMLRKIHPELLNDAVRHVDGSIWIRKE